MDHLVSVGPVNTVRPDLEPITRLAVERILTQLVDLSVGTGLKAAVGLRNVLVHDDLQTDYSNVAGAVRQAVQDFSDYVGEIAGWTSRQGPA